MTAEHRLTKKMASIWLTFGFVLMVPVLFSRGLDGACFQGQSTIAETVTGRLWSYCEMKGLKWTKGNVKFADHCMECSCTDTGLGCCQYGQRGGAISLPDGCSIYPDGCDAIFYAVVNGTKVTCITHEPIPGIN